VMCGAAGGAGAPAAAVAGNERIQENARNLKRRENVGYNCGEATGRKQRTQKVQQQGSRAARAGGALVRARARLRGDPEEVPTREQRNPSSSMVPEEPKREVVVLVVARGEVVCEV